MPTYANGQFLCTQPQNFQRRVGKELPYTFDPRRREREEARLTLRAQWWFDIISNHNADLVRYSSRPEHDVALLVRLIHKFLLGWNVLLHEAFHFADVFFVFLYLLLDDPAPQWDSGYAGKKGPPLALPLFFRPVTRWQQSKSQTFLN